MLITPRQAPAARSAARIALSAARLVCLPLVFLFGGTALAKEMELRYETTWGHFTLASAEVRYGEGDEGYWVEGTARTEGFLNLFFQWHGLARTEGRFASRERKVLLHRHEGHFDGKSRFTKVFWEAERGSVPETETEPDPDEEEVTPVAREMTKQTEDPFTVLLGMLDKARISDRCEGKARVWDGRRRYDLLIEHAGIEMIPPDRPWSYSGPAIACHWRVEKIGGFRRDAGKWQAKREMERRVVYLADWGFGHPVPVRAEIETSYGTVISRLRPPTHVEEGSSSAALSGSWGQ